MNIVPAHAGTHNHRCLLLRRAAPTAFANTPIGGYGSRLARSLSSGARSRDPLAWPGRQPCSAFDERLLDHKMAGLAVAAFEKAARLEHLAQLVQHAGAAAHH